MKEALKRLNAWTMPALAEKAIKVFGQHLSTSSLKQIKEETYGYIHDGISVKVKKPNGQTEEKKAAVIDFTKTIREEPQSKSLPGIISMLE